MPEDVKEELILLREERTRSREGGICSGKDAPEALSEKVAFEQRSKRNMGGGEEDIWGKGTPGRRSSQCCHILIIVKAGMTGLEGKWGY